MSSFFTTIPSVLKEIKKGKMIILVDSPKRENEGDFYIPADKAKAKDIITMIRKGDGLVCVTITQIQASRLSLPLMIEPTLNTEKTGVNFTVSINAKKDVKTGISAFDRLKTIKILSNPKSKESDLVRPGHIFGLVARPGGVLERGGHTEAAVDLARLADLNPVGVLCEILKDNGRTAKLNDLIKLSRTLDIKIASINDLKKFLKNLSTTSTNQSTKNI